MHAAGHPEFSGIASKAMHLESGGHHMQDDVLSVSAQPYEDQGMLPQRQPRVRGSAVPSLPPGGQFGMHAAEDASHLGIRAQMDMHVQRAYPT